MSAQHTAPAILTFLRELFSPEQYSRVVICGGTVRDLRLGRPCHDTDLTTALPPHELLQLGFRRIEPTGSSVIYFKHHRLFGNLEATIIDSMDCLENDLRRRDFTINAMAMTLAGTYFDPLNGSADLQNGLLRACSKNSFSIDPLRIFRAFRFEAGGWRMTTETEELIRTDNWKGVFSAMPVERFSNEMLKALALKHPERFFQCMIEFNAGKEFLPELFRLPQIPAGPLQHHPEGDLFSHSIEVLQRVAAKSSDPLARFCGLFHDIGKLATDPVLYPKHHGHDKSGFRMAAAFCDRLALSSAHRNSLAWVSSLHGKANLWDSLRATTKLTLAEQAIKAGIAETLPLVAAADKAETPEMFRWDEALRVAGMSARELGVDILTLETIKPAKRALLIRDKRLEVLKTLLAQGDSKKQP